VGSENNSIVGDTTDNGKVLAALSIAGDIGR
jgi:hypothetical protein